MTKIVDITYLCSMKHLYYILALLLVVCSSPVVAQRDGGSALRFVSDTADYGYIDEEGGEVVCSFEAVNEGDAPVEVINIVTTCGCTTAQWRRGSIEPDSLFRFEVRYNPMNRPGRIDRTIFVHTSDAAEPTRLRITGYVNARPLSVEEQYPFDMGCGVRVDVTFRALGYVEQGKSVEQYISYINTSQRSVKLALCSVRSSGMLTLDMPSKVAAGEKGRIVLRYTLDDSSGVYGTLNDVYEVLVDGHKSQYDISAHAIAVDNFDMVDDILAPKADISKKIIKFGDVKRDEGILVESFEVHNSGGSPLIVRQVESSDASIEVASNGDDTIAPNATATYYVKLNTAAISDYDNPLVARVYLITNDPMRPMQSVRVNALPNDL